jgi:tetratricopeptide (TPR) repeat protein
VLNDLAWILATHPDPEVRDGAEALEPAQRAADLTRRRDPQVLDTLAAAYAAAGRYGEAIANAQKALQLAPDDRDLRAHLDAYLESRPFLDPALE